MSVCWPPSSAATAPRASLEGLIEIYKRQKPGEPPTEDGARTLLNNLFFDPKRYDLMRVGRYKFNKKLGVAARIAGHHAAEDIIDPRYRRGAGAKGRGHRP